ncbi:MAG: hypothetical protein ACLRWQ_17295 [Flavonifractor plautii]
MGRIRPGSGARMVPGAVCAQPLSPLWGGPYAPAPGCRVRGGAGGHHGGGGLRPVRGHPVRRGLLQHRRSHDGGAVPHRRGAGALAQYVLRQNLVGCLLCSFAALALIDGVRIAARLLAGRGELAAMLGLAGREILWSLVFVFPVYALFLWVFRRVPKKTVL